MTKIKVKDWIDVAQSNGAGEIIVTSVNKEGTGTGFDLNLFDKISKKIKIPLIVNGGFGKLSHIKDLLNYCCPSEIAIGSALHYYTTFIKFGIGRATYDASQEIRNIHLTRQEAKILVKRFDGEKPTRYLCEILDYIGLKSDIFFKICNTFRSPHIWKKVGKKYQLRHTVNFDGQDD